jgi:bifunctional DNA-binding transcriptional regulator/antitoxin component of YhaV-PrlF toxin-antitoxin module
MLYKYYVKTTSKCQVTLPLPMRQEVGIEPNSEVEPFVAVINGRKVIAIAPAKGKTRGELIVQRMKGFLKGRGSTDQILRVIRGEP